MSKTALPRELALRIGLAARTLPEMDVAGLLAVLSVAVGLPPSAEAMAGLTATTLKQAAGDKLDEVDAASLANAVAILRGEVSVEEADLPRIEACSAAEAAGSLRVAVASNGAERVDGHFGSCRRFLVYQVGRDLLKLVAIRSVDAGIEKDSGDKNAYRADLVGDCQLLYVMSIGGPAAAKVVRRSVHPIKQSDGGDARQLLTRLQSVMAGSPPPWLAKVMGQSPEERIRFEVEAQEA